MAALPAEPAEGATLTIDIHSARNTTHQRRRRFAPDEVGDVVVRYLAAEGFGDCFAGGWTLNDATEYPEAPLPVAAFRETTLQASGLWPSARLALRRRPSHVLVVRTTRPSDGEALVECLGDDLVSDVARRAAAELASLAAVPSRRWRECRVVKDGTILDGDAEVGACCDAESVLFLAPPKPEAEPARPRPTRENAPHVARPPQPAEDHGPPMCRICFSEEASRDDPLISPCLCSGSMRHVHVSCLNAWRAAAPDARAQFRCDQCTYAYRIQRTRVAAFLQSEKGAVSLAAAVLLTLAFLLGGAGLAGTSPAQRWRLYRWLRVDIHPYRPARFGALREVLTLGAAAIGLLVFLLYAATELYVAYALHRAGVDWQRAAHPALLLGLWVAAETHDAKRGRALAVVGFVIAARSVHVSAFATMRRLSQRLGDRVLDVQAA